MEPLLAAYSMDNPGFSFKDPTGKLSFLQWIVGFVDDNSLNITVRQGQTIQEALKETEDSLSSLKNFYKLQEGI